MRFRVLDLFSGIGGFSLGLERTGHALLTAVGALRSAENRPNDQSDMNQDFPNGIGKEG